MKGPDLKKFVSTRRNVLLGGSMLLASGIGFSRTPKPNSPRISEQDFENLIPKAFGEWQFETTSGLILPPPDAMSAKLYENLLTRIYSSSTGEQVMFLVAYSNVQNGVLQLHRPEICYPAGGFRLTPTRLQMTDNGLGKTFPANIFTATSQDRTEHVLYWTRIGREFPLSWTDQRMAVIRANLHGIIPDGILVRVSTIKPDVGTAKTVLENFIVAMNHALNPQGRALLSGVLS
jgi:EpsI family protein